MKQKATFELEIEFGEDKGFIVAGKLDEKTSDLTDKNRREYIAFQQHLIKAIKDYSIKYDFENMTFWDFANKYKDMNAKDFAKLL